MLLLTFLKLGGRERLVSRCSCAYSVLNSKSIRRKVPHATRLDMKDEMREKEAKITQNRINSTRERNF